jgi:hypothetical protein
LDLGYNNLLVFSEFAKKSETIHIKGAFCCVVSRIKELELVPSRKEILVAPT